jgi:hypothetical protein
MKKISKNYIARVSSSERNSIVVNGNAEVLLSVREVTPPFYHRPRSLHRQSEAIPLGLLDIQQKLPLRSMCIPMPVTCGT